MSAARPMLAVWMLAAWIILGLLPLSRPALGQQTPAGFVLARHGCLVGLRHMSGPVTWSGTCRSGYAQGRGVATMMHEGRPVRLEGNFRNGLLHGIGSEIVGHGLEQYEGEFNDGLWSGRGTFRSTEGQRASCDGWQAGRMHGRCQNVRANGITYDGMMVRGAEDGQGEMRFPGGAWYIGAWRDGKAHGQGSYFHPQHGTMSGWWQNGCMKVGTLRLRVVGSPRGEPSTGPDCP